MKAPKPKPRKTRKGEKHERPLSLYPFTFNEALDKLLTRKPKPGPKKKA